LYKSIKRSAFLPLDARKKTPKSDMSSKPNGGAVRKITERKIPFLSRKKSTTTATNPTNPTSNPNPTNTNLNPANPTSNPNPNSAVNNNSNPTTNPNPNTNGTTTANNTSTANANPPNLSNPNNNDISTLGGTLNNLKITLSDKDKKQDKDKKPQGKSTKLENDKDVSSPIGKTSPFDKVVLKANGITYIADRVIGTGSFGVVVKASVQESKEMVAIKKVLQDKRFKNRELQIMRMLSHPNIVELKNSFYTNGDKPDEVYLNLVLEYVPETVYRVCRHYTKLKQTLPMFYVKLYSYQLLRSLAYLHAVGVCHRDIKPQNLLLDPTTGVLKLCDFGSAKQLVEGEPNVSYICSRYYRAPELIFGSTTYTTAIDIWSAGCVIAEMLLGQPLFPGESGVDQLVEIIKVLGTPTREQIQAMNSNYTEYKFPPIKGHPWTKVFRSRTPPEAIDLVDRLLQYTPTGRLTPLEGLAHPFFDELRQHGVLMPNGKSLPPLFNFTEMELKGASPPLLQKLLPAHVRNSPSGNAEQLSSSTPQSASVPTAQTLPLSSLATAKEIK